MDVGCRSLWNQALLLARKVYLILILINYVLTSLLVKGCERDWMHPGLTLFWHSDLLNRRHWLTKWNIVCRPKDQEGLGVVVLDLKNNCLLSKWHLKFMNEECVWQVLLHNKYLRYKTRSHVTTKPTYSPFWKSLLGVEDTLFLQMSFFC